MARSPLRDGWRVLMRAPAAVLAEIAWRWTFGLAFWATLYYGFREYFATIEISHAEYAAMRALQPYTWIAITARVMVAVMEGLHIIGPVIIPSLIILWIALATIGRAATVRALSESDSRTNWFATTALNACRVALLAVAILSYFGCGILIDVWLGEPAQHFAAAVLLGACALIVISLLWGTINWFLSLAPIFTVRDHLGFFNSLARSNELYRAHANSFASTGFFLGVIRSVLVIVTTILSLLPIARIGASHTRATVLIVAVVSLAYFALADALTVWRLATYISLSEPEPAPPVITVPEPIPSIFLPPQPPPLTPEPPVDSSAPESVSPEVNNQ